MNQTDFTSINIRGKLMTFEQPKIMAIVNVTPDSFFSGSRTFSSDALQHRIEKIVDEGADIIDIGGYSSRPGADNISPEEELRRLAAGIETVRKLVPDAIISIDTFRSDVALKCVAELGADIINDISGGTLDENMFETAVELKVPYILMHMRGTPSTMQSLTEYSDVTGEVMRDLSEKASRLHLLGVNDVIIDPGFGFAKTLKQNYQMLGELHEFKRLGMPLLVGVSRKSMIYKALDTIPEKALNGTVIANTIALMNGADILRVHDVAETREALRLVSLLKESTNHHVS